MLKQKDWVEVVVNKTGVSKKDAKAAFDFVFDSIREAVAANDKVKIAEVGTFKLKITKSKEQINITTGQLEEVPEHKTVAFKPYIEIDPKPEAIEVEGEVEVPVEEEAPAEEEAPEEEAQVESEEVKEEQPIVAEEEDVDEVVEDDGFTWMVSGQEVKTVDLVATLVQKSELSEKDVKAALNSVIENAKKVGKNSAEIREDEDSFSFVITK